jgi:hypothetical protein
MDRTTFELLGVLEHRGARIDGLGTLLDEADLVKFAKFTPSADSAAEAVQRARELVMAMRPAPVVDPLAPADGATGTAD